jgi:hypothetical protein
MAANLQLGERGEGERNNENRGRRWKNKVDEWGPLIRNTGR